MALLILPKGADVTVAFKWMYHPASCVVLVGNQQDYHADTLRVAASKNTKVDPTFENWIRMIHLTPADFKRQIGPFGKSPRLRPQKKRVLCVRAFPESIIEDGQCMKPGLCTKDDVQLVIETLGFKSRVLFNMTNETLADLTGDYLRKW